MTTRSEAISRTTTDKTQHYERLRARAREALAYVAPLSISARVLIRQGLSAWIQLDERSDMEHSTRHAVTTSPPLPAAQHSELLMVLTGLVFSASNKKEAKGCKLQTQPR